MKIEIGSGIEAESAPPLGCLLVDVKFVDGRKETIQLRRLTIQQVCAFADELANNRAAKLVALSAGRSERWCDTLTGDSFALIATQAVALSLPFLEELVRVLPQVLTDFETPSSVQPTAG